MVRPVCFNCSKHNELMSLRAEVKRFENGREIKNIRDERDKAVRKYNKSENLCRKLAEEKEKLKDENRSLKFSLKVTEGNYERLLSAYEAQMAFYSEQELLQSDSFFERIESVISELNRKVVALMEDNAGQAALIQKLKAQITKDSTNSSIPSSRLPNHKTPPNNREKTGRKPGGQKGHTGHTRKKLEPTEDIHRLPPPDEVVNNPEYYKTGKTITKQLIRISLKLEVIQYEADEYRHHKTRRKVHAAFPDGLVNEVEYDASVAALITLLHAHGNISFDKISEVLSDLTDGRLNPSKGMMADLEKKFSVKSAADRQQIFNRMLVYPYMHIDGTTVRVNGKNGQVLIVTSPAGTLLYHTGVKGDVAVKGTPAEEYDGTAIHDGEATFFHYGKKHQGCLVHELRYLKGSMDNEPHLTWASYMREYLQFLMHYVNEAKTSGRTELTQWEIKYFEYQYDEILSLARSEYKDNPPHRDYYIEGFNTMKRLIRHKEHYLHFLHDLSIPYQNNPAELIARKEKMHSKQSGGYRSPEYSQHHCDVLSVMESNTVLGTGRYSTLLDVFKRR
jgi:hypothetical protein